MTTRVMVDLETLSNAPNAAIVQIGAVDDGGRTFVLRVSAQSSMDAGLKADGSTIEWWMQQSEEARLRVFGEGPKEKLLVALSAFTCWLPGGEYEVWSNGWQDLAWLESAYRACKILTPWPYHAGRDLRVLRGLYPAVAKPEPTLKHDALADAAAQMAYLAAMLAAHDTFTANLP